MFFSLSLLQLFTLHTKFCHFIPDLSSQFAICCPAVKSLFGASFGACAHFVAAWVSQCVASLISEQFHSLNVFHICCRSQSPFGWPGIANYANLCFCRDRILFSVDAVSSRRGNADFRWGHFISGLFHLARFSFLRVQQVRCISGGWSSFVGISECLTFLLGR